MQTKVKDIAPSGSRGFCRSYLAFAPETCRMQQENSWKSLFDSQGNIKKSVRFTRLEKSKPLKFPEQNNSES